MLLASVRHKGLRRFVEDGDARGLKADMTARLQNILTALFAAPAIEELRGPPGWRVHQLTGDRAGTWSISVSGNWRLTFDVVDGDIANLDLEDYH